LSPLYLVTFTGEGSGYGANKQCDLKVKLASSCSQQKAQPKGREKVAANAGHS